MDAGQVVQLLVALGAGAILRELVLQVLDWARGRKGEERDAWAYGDQQARRARAAEETLHLTRKVALDAGANPDDLPALPEVRT